MENFFKEKKEGAIAFFANCSTKEDKYNKILELGKQSPHLPDHAKNPENLVSGCQSQTYLYTTYEQGKFFFQAESEALISSGLAFLLTCVYNGEKPEFLFKNPPTYLEELGLPSLLTPSRANGLYSIYSHMQKQALKILVNFNPDINP